jgi:hypothetical protein
LLLAPCYLLLFLYSHSIVEGGLEVMS